MMHKLKLDYNFPTKLASGGGLRVRRMSYCWNLVFVQCNEFY